MRSTILLSSVFFLALPLAACETGGPCSFERTPGKARIVSADPAPTNEKNCSTESVKVVFDFTPDDPDKADLAQKGVPLVLGGGHNPSRSWVESSGLTVGSEHPAIRTEITEGSCPPGDISLTDVDYAEADDQCF
jgi:hypothetical protein